jgi:MFS transporter, putative metabolite:H+ symporter
VVGQGLVFVLYEVSLAGTLAAVLRHDFGMGPQALTVVLASGFAGQFVGAVVLGRVADRVGRRRMYLINIGVYSLFSLVAAVAPGVDVLMVARFAAGVGLGAELVLADSYLADLLPARVRGRYMACAWVAGSVGTPLAGVLARWLVPLHPLGLAGWRWLFVLGGLGAAMVWPARRWLPESPRWLESVGRTQEAQALVAAWEDQAARRGVALPEPNGCERPVFRERLPLRVLFTGVYRRRTVMAWVLNGLEVVGAYGFSTVAPLVLAAKGYSIVDSLGFLALIYLGYPVGSVLALWVVERVERKVLVALAAAGMGVTGLLWGYADSPALVVMWGVLFTVIRNIFSSAFHVFMGELYPTALRTTAVGSAYSISSLGVAILPFVLLPLLNHFGPGMMFSAVAAAMALVVVDVLALGPRTTGRALETVTQLG